ncbi:MAG: cell division protein ZapA [Candidatus Berkiellales bacterium]
MSIGEKGICVRILEKEYRVSCTKHQEAALSDAAQYLDEQMQFIRKTGRVIGAERIAVMAALNIAHELLKLKSKHVVAEEEFSERIKVLQDKIDHVIGQNHPTTTVESKKSSLQETDNLEKIT